MNIEMINAISSSVRRFLELLGVLFIGLKLGDVIDWSWWWVTSPFWIPLAYIAPVLMFVAYKCLIKKETNNERLS